MPVVSPITPVRRFSRPSGAGVNVFLFSPEIKDSWDRYVLTHPDGSFFHLTAWKRVIEGAYRYIPYYFYAVRDGRIVGIVPLFLVSNWISGSCLISVPFAVYGGCCVDDSAAEAALLDEVDRLAHHLGVQYVELRNRHRAAHAGYHPVSRHSTFTLPLVSDTDALYRSLPKDVRYMIRKAEKAGLRVVHEQQQLDTFYDLLTINLRRLGTPAFPRELFDLLLHEYQGRVEIAVVYNEDKALAAGMSFYFRDSMQPYYVGSLDQAKTCAANDFLWWELIKRAALSGCSVFDFGRSKNESGNYDFKRKWNPKIEELSYCVRLIRKAELPDVSPMNPKFRVATKIWKKLPLGITRAIGPRMVRWFP